MAHVLKHAAAFSPASWCGAVVRLPPQASWTLGGFSEYIT
jgi:hypothetical protein